MELGDWTPLLGVDAVQDTMGELLALVMDKVTNRGWTDQNGRHRPATPITRYRISLTAFAATQKSVMITHPRPCGLFASD